jgi:glycosyltransferase involved in cell wall biosynthesis
MARKHVTVALAGDGGDELFAGYDRYVVNLERQHYDRVPQWLGKAYRHYVYPYLPHSFKGRKLTWNISLVSRDRYLDGISFLPACHRERALFSDDFVAFASQVNDPFAQFRAYYDDGPARDPLSRLLYLDTKTYMTADVLAKVDRMSMATSLEVRAPILDHVFIEYVTSLGPEWKYRHGKKKYILKKLAERLGVPSKLLHRRKQGFALPLVHWMREELREHLVGTLLEPRTLQRGYFNPDAIRRLVQEHLEGVRDRSGILWQLLVFELWHRNYLERQFGPVTTRPWNTTTTESIRIPLRQESSQPVSSSVSSLSATEQKPAIKVAIVAPSLRKVGGQAVQASLLLHNWQGDPEVNAEFVPIDPQFPKPLAWAERIPFLRTVIRIPFYWTSLWKAIGRADVAHIFSAAYSSFLLAPTPAWLVARLRGKKAVVNYRSGAARNHLSKSSFARTILRNMDQRVVPSGYLHDVFRGFGLNTEVIPNIVDLTQIKYRERRLLRPILVCNRGCEPYYAVDDVVRAFGEVQSTFPDAKLLLVGGGSLEPQVRQLAAQLQLRNVEFVGKVPRSDIGKYYEQADIFINASWLDNMPVSVLEAFAAGTPVVTTAPEGIRYIVEHGRTGLLCEPRDWRALGQNVITVLQNPDLASTLARNAYEQSQQYRWESVRSQWLRLYQSVLTGTVQSPAQAAVAPESLTAEVK